MSVRPKSVCDSCSATFIIVHELPEEEYTEQYCPFCGEENVVFAGGWGVKEID